MAITTKTIQTRRTATLITKEILFLLFLLAVVFLYRPGNANAATIDVATGSSSVNDEDSICQIDEAIYNINQGIRYYVDCVETGSYGTDDTINLPIGTITGPGSNLNGVYKYDNESLKIVGQGRGQSIINDAGLFLGSGGNYEVKDLTMTGWGIDVRDSNLTIDNVEIDLEYGWYPAVGASSSNVTIEDSYFHSMITEGSGFGLVSFYASENKTLFMENTTLSQANKGLFLQASSGSGLPTIVNATIQNNTFTGMTGIGGTDGSGFISAATGITAFALGENEDVTLNYTTINNTFSNITNSDGGFNKAAAIRESSAFFGSGNPDVNINHTAQNNLYAVGNGSDAVNYDRFDASSLLGSSEGGNGNFTTTTSGGNVSNDTSFSSYLTNPKDKHNQTSLASFLGVLTDNGGPAPTLALNDGSPAIDAGTNVSGMTTDQRGSARPQGNAFDAGAYESAFSAQVDGSSDGDPISDAIEDAAPNNGDGNGDGVLDSEQPHVTSLPGANGTYVTLVAPEGTTLTNTEILEASSLTKKDTLAYPFGLVSFTLTGVDSGATVPIEMYIASSEPASSFKARKYDANNETYRDLPGANIENVTVAGTQTLKLTYDITDGGDLDQDGNANGTIIDPVGLASSTLANTGQSRTLATILASTLIVLAPIIAFRDKLKSRLQQIRNK